MFCKEFLKGDGPALFMCFCERLDCLEVLPLFCTTQECFGCFLIDCFVFVCELYSLDKLSIGSSHTQNFSQSFEVECVELV